VDNQSSDDFFDVEAESARAGLSPMFGEWQKTFQLKPISHAAKGLERQRFKSRIQSELTNRFFFSDEVSVEIQLYLDVQKIIETSETADLDNFAKSILDGIKGMKGLLIDDSQVQSLNISWLDSIAADTPQFEVKISSSPDSFIPKPTTFYEMADGLWCPLSDYAWNEGEFQKISKRERFFILLHEDQMRSTNRKLRHKLRQRGFTTPKAFQFANRFASGFRGFHKSRIDPEFAMLGRSQWISDFEVWHSKNASQFSEMGNILSSQKSHLEQLRQAMDGG